jgi:hypothetical protein
MSVESSSEPAPGSAVSTAQSLACSRCDGPINPDDLIEGLAVRIDGLTVCPLCIETLSPALRIQINRVRALKGLAVVTYRVARPAYPDKQFYSFTNAGLLLLHRRAVVHGTEFNTPDLPVRQRPEPANGPATVSIEPPALPSKLTLYLGLGAASLVVIGGVLALALASRSSSQSTPSTSVTAPTVSNPQPAPVESIPALTPTTPATLANTRVAIIDDVVKVRELKDYRSEFADENAALEAGLADHATPELIHDLERDVLARGRANRERLTRILQQPGLSQRELDEIKATLVKAQPADRPAFTELRQNFADLNEILVNKRRLLEVEKPPINGTAPGGPIAALPVTPAAPVAPAAPAAPPTVAIPTPPVNDPAPSITTLTTPVLKALPTTSLWSGDIGPKPATFAEVTDPGARIPSPWPFFIGATPPRFAAAVRFRGPERKETFALQVTFPPEKVRHGGVFFSIYPKRKELQVTRLDVANVPPKVFNFTEREQWQGCAYRIEDAPSEPVTLQISEASETNSDPFWLGTTAAISHGDPSTLNDEISPSPLLTANPLLDWTQLLASLKSAARGRKQEQRWNDPKFLVTSTLKILGSKNVSAEKLNAALRLRRPLPDVENQVEVANLSDLNEIRKLIALKANPGLFNQKVIPATVFLLTDGLEASVAPAEWAKHVRLVNELLRNGEAKLPPTGFVPVWIIGSMSGAPLPTTAWSLLREDRSVLLLDLTTATSENGTSTKKTRSDTYQYLAEGIHTLLYQLRLVQTTQRAR